MQGSANYTFVTLTLPLASVRSFDPSCTPSSSSSDNSTSSSGGSSVSSPGSSGGGVAAAAKSKAGAASTGPRTSSRDGNSKGNSNGSSQEEGGDGAEQDLEYAHLVKVLLEGVGEEHVQEVLSALGAEGESGGDGSRDSGPVSVLAAQAAAPVTATVKLTVMFGFDQTAAFPYGNTTVTGESSGCEVARGGRLACPPFRASLLTWLDGCVFVCLPSWGGGEWCRCSALDCVSRTATPPAHTLPAPLTLSLCAALMPPETPTAPLPTWLQWPPAASR